MIETVTKMMIAYFGTDLRRINHSLKVRNFARIIASDEPLGETGEATVDLAAILHDIGIREAERKHGSSAGNLQEIEGPPVAEAILREAGVPESVVGRVSFIVGHHHSYDAIDGTDFRIIVEADFLVNAFEEGLSKRAIESVREKLFRTGTGRWLLDTMYLPDRDGPGSV